MCDTCRDMYMWMHLLKHHVSGEHMMLVVGCMHITPHWPPLPCKWRCGDCIGASCVSHNWSRCTVTKQKMHARIEECIVRKYSNEKKMLSQMLEHSRTLSNTLEHSRTLSNTLDELKNAVSGNTQTKKNVVADARTLSNTLDELKNAVSFNTPTKKKCCHRCPNTLEYSRVLSNT